MNRNIKLILPALAIILAFSVTAKETAVETKNESVNAKSVAWYVANIKDAMAMNKECFGANSTKELQTSPNCTNSLQALKISHVGNN